MLVRNLTSSFYSRNSTITGDQKHYALSFYYTGKALDSGNMPMDLYNAGMKSLFWFGDYHLAYKFFSTLQNHPAAFIVHSNSRIAECLIKMNRKREALEYMNKEIKVFPLSSIAVYNKLLLEKELGNTEAAEITAQHLIKLMNFKGLKLEDMKKILEDPDLDDHFEKLKSTQ